MEQIFKEIKDERLRQDAKWGVQNHHPMVYGAILGEEVGEVHRSLLENDLENPIGLKAHRSELIQVAAVAVAMVECLDRERNASTVKDSRQLEIQFPD